MPILVTGASGFIGRHLTGRLLERGQPVRVLTRRPERLPAEWTGRVEIVAGSLPDSRAIETAMKGASLVFHLAAELRDPPAMHAVNADAPRALIEAAQKAGAKRFVHLSSVGVIGADGAGEVNENAECKPKNEYERTKREGELAVLRFAEKTGFDTVVIRPTIVFGEGVEGRDSMLEWMRAVRDGRFRFIGTQAMANYVYVGDVVDAMLRLSERPSPGGEIFHVADPAPMRDFVGAMADALGAVPPAGTIPVWAAYAAAAGLEASRRLLGTPAPLTVTRVQALSTTVVFSGTKAGVTLPFGYRAGLQRTVRWYRVTGRL